MQTSKPKEPITPKVRAGCRVQLWFTVYKQQHLATTVLAAMRIAMVILLTPIEQLCIPIAPETAKKRTLLIVAVYDGNGILRIATTTLQFSLGLFVFSFPMTATMMLDAADADADAAADILFVVVVVVVVVFIQVIRCSYVLAWLSQMQPSL